MWPPHDRRASKSVSDEESSDSGESMSEFALRGQRRVRPYPPPASAQEEVLSPDALEHGAYYSGKLGATATIARWHARKRRFVFGEYALGHERVRSVAHIAESATGDRFAPLTKIEAKHACRVSDYAFETAP